MNANSDFILHRTYPVIFHLSTTWWLLPPTPTYLLLLILETKLRSFTLLVGPAITDCPPLDNNVLIGATKPWLISFDEAGSARIGDCEKHCHNHLQLWWQIFNNLVRPALNKTAETCDQTVLSCLNTVTSSGYMESPPSPTSLPPADSR